MTWGDQGHPLPDSLMAALDRVAATPVLLVVCDYDGTLAPIVGDPSAALPQRESIVALRSLASLDDTHVAVISGRSLRDLAALSRLPPEVHLVGSHGSEFDPGFALELPPETLALRDELLAQATAIARRYKGTTVEAKPAAVAFHYRNAGAAGEDAAREVLDGPATLDGVHVTHGKLVVELSAIMTDKGAALDRLRQQVGASAVVFVGDDITDENAFRRLTAPDVGVKVGDGESLAEFSIGDTTDVARLLAVICQKRRSWLEGDVAPAIERHTLLSDQRTVALLTPDAKVTWLCHPRADSPSIFAELLGGPSAGSFAVRPDPPRPPLGQRYVGDTFIVETRWPGLRLVDYLDVTEGRAFESAGRSDLVRVVEGDGSVVVEFAPHVDFGRAATRLEVVADGIAALGAPEAIELLAPGLEWELVNVGTHVGAVARVHLEPGRPLVLQLRLGGNGHPARELGEAERRHHTHAHWSAWAGQLSLPIVARGMVRRSALVLKALCHQPSGAMLAAATTSLPEVLGGSRNWDYRYCWPRDAAIATDALVRLGSNREALEFLDWLIGRAGRLRAGEVLRPLYPLAGDEFLPEAVIPTLNGYHGSRPVRIGNLAEHQLQLDMFGPVVQLVARLAERGVPITDRYWDLVRTLVDFVVERWGEPDHGIWELRAQPRHHVHSKVMCWVAVDRAITIARQSGRRVPPSWSEARDAIRRDVVERGWSSTRRSFVAAYDSEDLDASVLWVALSGMLPHDDERVVSTVTEIERELRRGQVVDRYHYGDGLPGREGGFIVCATWLVEALAAIGRSDDARQLFGGILDLAGPTGMLSEQYDPETETSLGNVPQAYSHAGLIHAALAIVE